MKIAIMSDSHDHIVNLIKALKFTNKEKIKTLIHCGDLCAPSILTEVMVPNFKGQMHLVHGNVGDPELLEEVAKGYKDITIHGYMGKITISDGHSGKPFEHTQDKLRTSRIDSGQARMTTKIAFTHFPDAGKKLAESGKYDLVFYGHTHRPWIEEIKTKEANEAKKFTPLRNEVSSAGLTKLINPGTLAGMFYKATFAIYDTENDKLELKILELIKI